MHDVFISYKSEDAHLAMRVRFVLEGAGIPCWIAQRDIGPGDNYAADIPAAIAQSRVVILILTENAQESPWIPKELDSAISLRRQILPLKIGSFPLNTTFSFLLTGVQFYDATADLDGTVRSLLPKIHKFIAETGPAGKRKTPKAKKIRSYDFFYFLLTLAVFLAVLHYLDIVDLTPYVRQLRKWAEPLFAWLKVRLPQLPWK